MVPRSCLVPLSLIFAVAATGTAGAQDKPSLYLVDSGGRQTETLEIGASLETGARGSRRGACTSSRSCLATGARAMRD